MGKEQRLFAPDFHDKHESEIKKKIREFILGYKSLEIFLSLESDPNDERSLLFYSELYENMSKLLTHITCFVVVHGYKGRRKRVDEGIRNSQKILGLLKILHLRYLVNITSADPFSDPRWCENTDDSNAKIIQDIKYYFKKMYSFKP
jgi:hypothetical protein